MSVLMKKCANASVYSTSVSRLYVLNDNGGDKKKLLTDRCLLYNGKILNNSPYIAIFFDSVIKLHSWKITYPKQINFTL